MAGILEHQLRVDEHQMTAEFSFAAALQVQHVAPIQRRQVWIVLPEALEHKLDPGLHHPIAPETHTGI